MKTELTEAEQANLPAIRDKWLAIGLATGTGDREAAWKGVCAAYKAGGRTEPRIQIWMESPYRSVIACSVSDQVRYQVYVQVRAQVSYQVRDQVSDQVRDQVIGQVIGQVGAQVRAEVGAQVLDQVHAQVSGQVVDQVSDQVIGQVRGQVGDQVGDQVSDQVIGQVIGQVSGQVGAQVRAQVRDQISDQVRAQVGAQVVAFIPSNWWWLPGQFDSYWLAFYDALQLHCSFERLSGLIEVARNCAIAWLFPDVVVFCDRPSVICRDPQHRIHCETGPAVGFSDGWGVWAIHGVRVPQYVIEQPDLITVVKIDEEKNAEVRRVMIDRYGQERYLMDSEATAIHHDDYGTLYRKEIPGDEPLVMVKVCNSTPEHDGTFKDYFLRVPATMIRAREAVAWTFGKSEMDYEPSIQT